MTKQVRPVLTATSLDIANRRVYELSKPDANGMMTVTQYVNDLITADGKAHPEPKKRNK